MVLSDNTALYFFSALLQADAAVVAVIAVVIVFKLQSLQAITSNLHSFIMHKSEPEDREVLIQFDKESYEGKETIASGKTGGIMAFLSHELPYHKKMDVLKKKFVFPSICFAVLIILNIVGLIFASTLHQDCPRWEIIAVFANGLFHVIGFVSVIWVASQILKQDVQIDESETGHEEP